ncbi:MAG: ribonuclease Z [Candidatus Aenigmarchaeota archaeon]|nr:ribonuclease Z [Candidatus Aenigmarchaeota archaeon]
MLQITFLGTVSGIPTKDRNHSAIVFEYYTDKKETFLFDCGEGTQKQLMMSDVSFMDIDNIFITHWHADHFAGLIPLIQTMSMEKRKKELTIFGPEAERFVEDIIDLGYFGLRFPVNAVNVPFEGSEITKIFEGEESEILSIPTLHTVPSVAYCFKEKDRWGIDLDRLKSLGLKRGSWLNKVKKHGEGGYKGQKVKIEDIADKKEGLKAIYTGDTKPCDNVVKLSQDADLLIHDGTFLELDESGGKYHADVVEAAKSAKKANVKQLILTHISRRYQKDDIKEMESRAKKVFPNTSIAHDFMKIQVRK